jgi:hypothetical protein
MKHMGGTFGCTTVGYYHGADELYELDGIPGMCTKPVSKPMANPALHRTSGPFRRMRDADDHVPDLS